ncbi:MAG: hypothetical protein ACRC46_13725 [Thermoguttaceae bacterium]
MENTTLRLEILVEDASGKIVLESLVPKVIGESGSPHRYRILNIQEIKHRVMARMPRHTARTLPWDEIMFETLTVSLRAYGRSLPPEKGVVVIVVDSDYHDPREFASQLESIAPRLDPAPHAVVCLATEEVEAWLLGDLAAVVEAYPAARQNLLAAYENDSICGTWETLADAVYRGGAAKLTAIGYPELGRVKCQWATKISHFVDVDENDSPSFQNFRDTLRQLTANTIQQ